MTKLNTNKKGKLEMVRSKKGFAFAAADVCSLALVVHVVAAVVGVTGGCFGIDVCLLSGLSDC